MKLKEMMKKGLTFALTAFVAMAPVNVSAASWQQNTHGWWWQEDDHSYPTDTWKYIYGKWYYFNHSGYMLGEGWHWINDKCYYMYAGGSMAADTWVDGSYVDGSGAWVPNAQPAQWKYSAGRWWYQNEDGSYPANEWEPINGAWYYFDAEGWMLGEGWHWINDKCYYMYAGGSMAANTWINGSYVDGSGAWVPPADQWISSEGRWWYKHSDGSCTKNDWEYINDGWYYFDADGWMLNGGWHWLDDAWYYFDKAGWSYDDGWHWIDGKCYYFYEDGTMAADAWVEDNYVDASGAWVPGKVKCDHVWEEKYEDIEHPEEGHTEHVLISPEKGHYEKVMVKDQWTEYKLVKEALYENKWIVDKEAWTEKVPNPAKDKYEIHIVCNGCRKDFGDDYAGIRAHNKEQMLQGNLACGGWHDEEVLVEKGYNIIEHPEEGHYEKNKIADAVYESIWHPAVYEDKWIVDKEAVYEDRWIVDKEAWTEHKLVGYLCSHCGEVKEATDKMEK